MADARTPDEHPTGSAKCAECGSSSCPITYNNKSFCMDCFKKIQADDSSEKKHPSKGLDLKSPSTSMSGVSSNQGSLSNLSITSPTDPSRPGSGASMTVNPPESTMSDLTDRSLEASSSAGTPMSGTASEELPVDKVSPDDSSSDSSSAAGLKIAKF